MPKQKHQHTQERQAQQEVISQRNASQSRAAGQSMDHMHTNEQLRKALAEKQKDLAKSHTIESRSLYQYHEAKHEELVSAIASDRVSPIVDQVEGRAVEISAVEHFQAFQREQVAERQALEQKLLRDQLDAVSSLETRLRDHMDAVARLQAWMEETKRLTPEKRNELTSMQERLEGRYQAERRQLENNIRIQDQGLREHREKLEIQMKRDQRALQQALYGDHVGIERRNLLQDLLARQETAHQELGQAVQAEIGNRQLDLLEMQTQEAVTRAKENDVLDQKFSRHQVMRDLWQEAIAATSARKAHDLNTAESARASYKRVMRAFVTRLTRENDTRAAAARQIFMDAGFKFLEDKNGRLKRNLPVLALSDKEVRLIESKHYDLLRVSGQHLRKISQESSEALNPDNLVFMIARDNMHMDVAGELRRKVIDEMKAKNRDEEID